MRGYRLTDLDADPSLTAEVLELYRGCRPGRNHAVCGDPAQMGLEPTAAMLREALGTLVTQRNGKVLGALTLCPYSDEQLTLWGPVIHRAYTRLGIGTYLLGEARQAAADGGFESIRVHVDHRNRAARSFMLGRGLSHWKTNLIYERDLLNDLPDDPGGVSLAKPGDHGEITEVITDAFPEANHCRESLAFRERQGYRHYFLQDAGTIVAAAAVKVVPQRNWLGFIGVRSGHRGRQYGHRLLAGVIVQEARLGATRLGLEVLEDNAAANRIYRDAGFRLAWKAAIMTGPV